MSSGKYWSKAEDAILLRRMDGLTGMIKKRARKVEREGVLPGRIAKSIVLRYRKLRRMRAKQDAVAPIRRYRNPLWSEEDNALVRQKLDEHPNPNMNELADMLFAEGSLPGRSRGAIHVRLCRISSGRSVERSHYSIRWTPEESALALAALRERPSMSCEGLAEFLVSSGAVGRHTVRATESHLSRLKRNPSSDVSTPVPASVTQASKQLGADKRPLIQVMLLLDKARGNYAAWDRIFPRALNAVEDIYADIDAVKTELEKTRFAVKVVEDLRKQKMREEADKLSAEMDDCDASLRQQMLADRELKKGG